MRALTVKRRTPIDLTLPCLSWEGTSSNEGYGRIVIDSRVLYVHRLAHQLYVGPVPRGWEVDHLCHNVSYDRGECAGGVACIHRACYEPAHLEAVTSSVNSSRGGHPLYAIARSLRCSRGHDLTNPQHAYTRPDGRVRCRTCSNMTQMERRSCEH